jgi:predicted RND superfamily exporter protein
VRRAPEPTHPVRLRVVSAVGASTLAICLLGVQVSVLGALSGPLVIAVCTGFSVLIIERHREERRGVEATPSRDLRL